MFKNLASRPRLSFFLLGIGSFASVLSAHFLGEFFNLEVCAMCWFQRLAFLLAGVGFLIVAAFPKLAILTRRLPELGLLLGLASSARQSYLLAHPEAASDSCAAGLWYYLQIEDYVGFLKAGLLGGVDCAENQPLFFGLHLPQWSLLAFVIVITIYIVMSVMSAKAGKKVSS